MTGKNPPTLTRKSEGGLYAICGFTRSTELTRIHIAEKSHIYKKGEYAMVEVVYSSKESSTAEA